MVCVPLSVCLHTFWLNGRICFFFNLLFITITVVRFIVKICIVEFLNIFIRNIMVRNVRYPTSTIVINYLFLYLSWMIFSKYLYLYFWLMKKYYDIYLQSCAIFIEMTLYYTVLLMAKQKKRLSHSFYFLKVKCIKIYPSVFILSFSFVETIFLKWNYTYLYKIYGYFNF